MAEYRRAQLAVGRKMAVDNPSENDLLRHVMLFASESNTEKKPNMTTRTVTFGPSCWPSSNKPASRVTRSSAATKTWFW